MPLPSSTKKAIVQKNSTDLFEAIAVVSVPLTEPKPEEVIIKSRFLGVNATDLNASTSRGSYNEKIPPFDIGHESLGEIVAVGSNVKNVQVGQPVVCVCKHAFGEYITVLASEVMPLPKVNPEYLPLIVCGQTAALGLDKKGQIKADDKVLITAAAGGTGHIAVQWAKNVGCHVIGTCSSEDKVQYLKSIGCDRPINYKEEDIDSVLKKEYPDGVDVIWETVGGSMFEMLYKHLGIKGRLITLGLISGYKSNESFKPIQLENFPIQLLLKSQSICGFYLNDYLSDMREYLGKLLTMHAEKKLKMTVDYGKDSPEGEFIGVKSVARALQYLYSGKNLGKVIITL